MPNKRLSVNKTREILRLHFEFGLSERKIATSCGVARSTVADYLSRAAEASLTWPLPKDLTEDDWKGCSSHRIPGALFRTGSISEMS